jgi:F0F1-type ATP synthase delta subunit
MSLTKRLAKHYVANEASADRIVTLLKKFKLEALVPQLQTNSTRYAARKARYDEVYIRSVTPLTDAEVAALKALVGAPDGVETNFAVDGTLLKGAEVSYGGKKWSGDAGSILRRFVETR